MKSDNFIIASDPDAETARAAAEASGGGRSAPKRQKSNIVAPTVWGKYKTQLHELMANLRKTNSRYIRCIKPNMKKVPVLMEHIPTIEQLRCAGVVAAVTLARSAFPNRLDNASVRFRYGSMWEKSQYPSAKTSSMDANQALRCDCDAILHCALKSKETVNDEGKVVKAYVVGRTKSYFRAGALEYLEANRKSGLDGQATTIQRFARGWLVRKQVGDYAKRRAAEELAAKKEKERAEREAREKYEREKAERQAKRDADRKKYSEKIENLKKALKDADHDRKSRLSSIKEAKEALERDIEELRDQTNEDARKAANEPKKIVAQQKKKLEEQTKMIDLLKKENKKYRKEAEKIKTKFDLVRENNDKLLRANEEAGNNFEATDSSSMRVHERNEKLTTTLETAKADNKRMKDECMAAQDKYMSQAETRLEYQKAMARILNMIQDTLRDPQLIEDTVCLALECESEAKSVMAALEAETEDY
jgi:myosin heavy subunit